MTTSHVLWRVNNEYRRRLTQAKTLLSLLEQLILTYNGEHYHHLLAALGYARQQVELLTEEHRNWRYHFYYESLESKRMVQTNRAVNQALARFSRMRSQHENLLYEVYTALYSFPRPDPQITHLPNGDLWTLTEYALQDLMSFGDYMNELNQSPIN